MFKIYQKYIIKNFFTKFFYVSAIFLSLVIILGILEEVNFFKNLETHQFYPYFLTLLNAPIALFEIFPFIILISSQFFLYSLIKNDELNLLRKNGISNLNLIKILFFLSIFIGLFNITIYYNVASKLKFKYSEIKNNFSKDNKYLAMVTDSGLWIKDEIDNKKYIIKSNLISENFLIENIINEFSSDFELLRTIQSNKIDISENKWIIYNPVITTKDNTLNLLKEMSFTSNFNSLKINNLFSNISSFDVFKLYSLKKDYEGLGYSTNEVVIHMLKLFSTPIMYGIIILFSMIIMFNFVQYKSLLFQVVLGIILSVLIYYVNFIFNSLGSNGKIPIYLSVYFPLSILLFVSLIGLININEK